MVSYSTSLAPSRIWGFALLFLGLLCVSAEIWMFTETGTWSFLSFMDILKITAKGAIHSRSGDWVFDPRNYLWLHRSLSWTLATPTFLIAGAIGFLAPDVRRRQSKSAEEITKLLVR
ncbi:MAG: hypothetical protein RIR97_1042 [Pseudomonadota bacterium]